LMKPGGAKQARAEPSRGAKTRGAEFGMSRANASVRFQSSGLAGAVLTPSRINHNWRRPTMPFVGRT
jgi:hypothetical protein